MRRHPLCFASLLALLSGCATVMHGPYQDVRIESDPPGAKATISPMLSARGPNFLDDKKQTVTTPATVRLRRDNTYRIELEKSGYKIGNSQVLSSYDWLWAPLLCGPCEAVGELPTFDTSDNAARCSSRTRSTRTRRAASRLSATRSACSTPRRTWATASS